MQQAITALHALVDHQQHWQHDDDGEASVQGGGDAHAPDARDCFAGQAGVRGNGGRGGGCAGGGGGRGFAPQCVRRQCDDPNFAQLVHRDEDGWAYQNSPCPNSWVLLMLKSISIGS
jgi:hypothetical protein